MIPQYWSWLLAAIGVSGLWLAGSKRALGWHIGLAVQVLWIVYAVATRQWGFIASALAFAAVNLRNLIRWKREAQDSPREPRSTQPRCQVHDTTPREYAQVLRYSTVVLCTCRPIRTTSTPATEPAMPPARPRQT